MKLKYIVGGMVQMIVKVVLFAFIIMYILRMSTAAYDYGYRVFVEPPISGGEGRIISIYIEEKDSARDVGKMLQDKGLIRDANLFWIQEFLSEYHGKIRTGVYDLNTSMTTQEMLAVIAEEPEEESEE
ncbi:MAG: endolytic transglycosylase MltG [Lachnospiraceae bacterium]|nr:endolytic transglycosylase MltG [Lachnospiraceae bacterium]